MTLIADANSDLDSFDSLQLTEERNRLVAKGRQQSNDPTEPFTRHLSDEECERLVAIYNQLRRRSGGQPRASATGAKKSKKAVSDDLLLNM